MMWNVPENSSLNGFLFLSYRVSIKESPEAGKEKVIYDFKEADEAEAEAEAHETPCIADKGGDRDGDISLVVCVVGILNKELDHSYIFHSILMDKIVHCLVVNFCLWWIDRIVNVAYIIILYHGLNVVTGGEHSVSRLNEVRFVGIIATPEKQKFRKCCGQCIK